MATRWSFKTPLQKPVAETWLVYVNVLWKSTVFLIEKPVLCCQLTDVSRLMPATENGNFEAGAWSFFIQFYLLLEKMKDSGTKKLQNDDILCFN